MPRYRQEVINIRIADILRQMGFGAIGETITGGKLPDVMVEINGLKVNIEGWFERESQIDTLKSKCKKRIEDGICDIAIGLLYPEILREAENDEELINKIKQSDYKVFIFSPSTRGVVEQSLGRMKLEQIAENLNYLYTQAVKTDLLKEEIAKIEKAIQTCAGITSISSLFFSSEKVIEELKKALGIEEKIELREKSFREDLVKIALFVIFDGLLFHQVLSSHYRNINGLEKAPESNILSFIREEWGKIMKINYLPIFTFAFEVVNCLPVSPETDEIFKKLTPIVLETISSGVLLKHDLMGRVYHKLLLRTTGKYYASYYTSIPASTLLSNLAIKTENPDLKWDFGSLEKLKELKIIDPACGSGTLLSGIYMALKDKYIFEHYKSGGSEKLNLPLFYKIMMEEVLQGWDILDYAGHLTLITLALHNPDASFDRCKVYILPSGKTDLGNRKNEKIYLGSLNFLKSKPQITLPIKDFMTLLKEKGIKEEREIFFQNLPTGMDVVIMNPPFSRSCRPNIKFGYTGKEIREQMNKELRKLGKELGYKQIGQAGLGAYFIILADKLLKQGGRLALVIPRAILSGVSWKEIRENILLKNYEIEYIISNYDSGNKELGIEPWNWSENTDLGEVLIVARKTDKPIEKRFTTFINLWNKPANELESLKIVSDSIKARKKLNVNSLKDGEYEVLKLGKEIGGVCNVSQKYLEKNFLIPCLFANPNLNKFVFSLIYIPSFPLIPLHTLISNGKEGLGVDIKQIKSTFEKTDIKTPYKILWGHTSLMNTLELNPIYVKYGKLKKQQTSIYKLASNFLIADRPHLKTENLIAVYSKEKLLATAFWEIQLKPEEAKLLTLWLNSTFGFLIYLSNSINSMGEIFKIKKAQIENLPVIDINQFTKKQKDNFLALYESLKNKPFSPFPKEFKLASQGKGVRKQIDDAFIKALNLKIDLQPYYEMLAKEPVLTLERW
jgi:type I restriction-modification system DNA methylase subunit